MKLFIAALSAFVLSSLALRPAAALSPRNTSPPRHEQKKPTTHRVRTADFDGIVISRKEDGWRPTDADIIRFESALREFFERAASLGRRLPSCPLNTYKRQYWAITADSGRSLWVHFYHDSTNIVQSGRWLKTNIYVNDGGDSYFNVRYNPVTAKVYGLSVNLGGPPACASSATQVPPEGNAKPNP